MGGYGRGGGSRPQPSPRHPPGGYTEATWRASSVWRWEELSWGRQGVGQEDKGLDGSKRDLGWLHGEARGSQACETLGSVPWGSLWKIPPAGPHTSLLPCWPPAWKLDTPMHSSGLGVACVLA